LLDAGGHSQMPAWIVGSTGVALFVIGACLWVCDQLPRVTSPFVAAGQLALTFYIVHVFLLRRGLRDWPWQMSPPSIIAAIAAIYFGFVLVAWMWRSQWRHGPAEAVLRIGDSLVRPSPSPPTAVWVERPSNRARPRG
jgi:uncharacterized membrane protein YeiB